MKLGLKTVMIPADGAAEPAARCLADGGLVAFPTETVYGLGADATNARAVARLYEAKGRPSFNPLIAHVSDLHAARQIAHFDDKSLRLAEAFWPGPLTLVLPKIAGCPVSDLATAGLETASPNSGPSGGAGHSARFRKTRCGAISQYLRACFADNRRPCPGDLAGRIDLIVDGGPVAVGVESTIVGCFNTSLLLRPGGLPREDIERVLGEKLARIPEDAGAADAQPLAPGMLASHYAPRARVRLNADKLRPAKLCLPSGQTLSPAPSGRSS
jgi:L-threonylcarbamoyladenylate synthase